MGRTRISTLALIAGGVLVVGWGGLALLSRRGTYLAPVPWAVTILLLILAAVVLWAARAVRAYLRGDRPNLDPLRAARTAALAKAAAVAGALLVGWYGAQVLLALQEIAFEPQQDRALAAGAACAAAVVLTAAGLVGEGHCRLPPPDEGDALDMRQDGAHD